MKPSEETACGVTPEEFERFMLYCCRSDNSVDNLRRAELLGFGGGVRIAPGAIVRIGANPIGENSFIGLYCYVNGDVRIGRNVLIGRTVRCRPGIINSTRRRRVLRRSGMPRSRS